MTHALFEEAKAVLLFSQPFFGTLLLKLKHVERRDLPTLCVTKSSLEYNPDFLDTLTLDEVVFCIAHEVMHHAWMHLPRMEHYIRAGIGPDGKPLDPMKFNRALDYPINALLQQQRIGAVIDPKKFKVCLDPKYPATMTPEEVYCKLPDEKGNSGGGGGSGQQALDEHDSAGAGGDEDAITPADVMQAAAQHKAIRGELPAGMERIIEELKKPAVSPWARLRRFVTKSLPGADATTWRRLQRRYIVRGVGMPGPTQQGAGHVGVVTDTSGSIDQDMLNLFAGHLASIMSDARPVDVRLYWTDSRVHRVDVAKNGNDLRTIMAKKVPGGGGTDMRVGVKAAESDKCDAIIVLTDGFTEFCGSSKPLIWAITSQVNATGGGETIHI